MSGPPPPAPAARRLLGISLILAAGVCFAVLDTTAKVLGADLSVPVVLWGRYLVQAMLMLVWLLVLRWQGGRNLFATAHPRFQLLRGGLLLLTSALLFFGIRFMPVAEFTAVGMLTPVVATVLAAVFLHERLTLLRGALVLGGFAGALTVVRPGSGLFGWVVLIPLTMTVVYAVFQLLTRKLSGLEHPLTTHFYTGLVGSLVMSLVLGWGLGAGAGGDLGALLAAMPLRVWALLLVAGLAGTVGHLFLILALGTAPMATLMPFTYAQIAFASLAGWIVFRHVPDGWAFVGMAVVAVCGGASVWLNLRDGSAARPARNDAVVAD